MSWSRRHLLLGLTAVAGCGLHPVYGPGAKLRRGALAFDTPQNEAGFLMLEAFEDTFGTPDAPEYVLRASPKYVTEEAIENAPQRTQREHLAGSAAWTLKAGSQIVASGTAQGFIALNSGLNIAAEGAAERDARVRLMKLLTERIATQIWATL